MDRVLYLRRSLEEAEFKVMGAPSAIVPVVVGPEALARMVCRRLPAQRVVANLVEYPAVAKGNARLRLQAMASHTTENIDDLVAALSLATDAAQSDYRQYCERAQRVQTSQASEIHAPQLHRLLAIDDNIDSAELVVRVARKCGYEAEPLSKQEDLPARLKAAPIDVLTLDLCMPEQDGIRLMSVLQENGFKGQIIIVSGQPGWLRKSAGRLAQARGLSVVADFAKPLDLAAMTQLLQKLQSERRPEAA
jgi:PleD family two-component response regulator